MESEPNGMGVMAGWNLGQTLPEAQRTQAIESKT